MYKRISLSLILLIGSFFLPPWLVLIIAISGIFVFDYYFEGIFAGFIVDVLYGTSSHSLQTPLLYTLIIVTAFILIGMTKSKLKFYI